MLEILISSLFCVIGNNFDIVTVESHYVEVHETIEKFQVNRNLTKRD